MSKWDFDVRYVTDFKNIIECFIQFEPHLVLIDIILPFYNGFYWCNEIRKISKVPIMFISSASDNMNIIMAINMGGDDFIEKPFDLNVLTAKVHALIRRTYSFVSNINLIEYKGVILNLNNTTLLYQNKKLS